MWFVVPCVYMFVLQVKTITALTLAALAEAASPYGIESFDDVLEPLWRGIRLGSWAQRTVSLVRCWDIRRGAWGSTEVHDKAFR